MKYFSRCVYVLLVFLTLSKDASAFFVPSALQLLGSALSNVIAAAIIILIAFFGSVFMYLKNGLAKRKKRWIVLALLFICILTTIIFHNFLQLKKINSGYDDDWADHTDLRLSEGDIIEFTFMNTTTTRNSPDKEDETQKESIKATKKICLKLCNWSRQKQRATGTASG